MSGKERCIRCSYPNDEHPVEANLPGGSTLTCREPESLGSDDLRTDGGVEESGSDHEEAGQSVLTTVDELVTSSSPWTSRREVRQKSKNGTGKTLIPLSKDETDRLIAELVEDGEIVYWHGWITLNNDQLLQTAIEKEREADVTRKILIGKLNKIRRGKWDFQQESLAREGSA